MPSRAVSAARLLILAAPLVVASSAGCKSDAPSPGPSPSAVGAAGETQRVAIKAVQGAFEPAEVQLVQGRPAVLEFTRVADSECVNAVLMPWMDEAVDLPMNEKVEIAVDTSKAGTFTYSCWMRMVFGKVVIDPAPGAAEGG